MSKQLFNPNHFASVFIGLCCLSSTLAPSSASANPAHTNMSNGTGCNMSNGTGHGKGSYGKGEHGKTAGEYHQRLSTHQRAYSRAAEQLAEAKQSANAAQLAAAQAAEASAGKQLARTHAEVREYLSHGGGGGGHSPMW
jgi:hypothetical protein